MASYLYRRSASQQDQQHDQSQSQAAYIPARRQDEMLGNSELASLLPEHEADGSALETPAYRDQLDNEINPEGTCNVTTLAMMLLSMTDEASAYTAVIQRLQELGEKRPAAQLREMQLEDLLSTRFALWTDEDWRKCARDNPDFFYAGWYEHAVAKDEGWHQIMESMTWVMHELSDVVGDTQMNTHGGVLVTDGADYSHDLKTLTSAEYYQDTLGPVLESGGTVSLGTKLTSGHIVMLVGVEDDGIIVNDPNGMQRGIKDSYLNNGDEVYHGEKGDSLTRLEDTMINHRSMVKPRLRENKDLHFSLLSLYAQAQAARLSGGAEDIAPLKLTLPSNMGEQVFFSWAEVQKFSIGKWNIITGQAADKNAADKDDASKTAE